MSKRESLEKLRRREAEVRQEIKAAELRLDSLNAELALIKMRIANNPDYKPPIYKAPPFGNPVGMPRDKDAMAQYKRTVCTVDLDGLDLEL